MKKYLVLLLTLLLAAGCVLLRGPDHPDAEARGRWDSSDARQAVRTLVGEMMSSEWLERFREGHEHPPSVLLGELTNETREKIDTNALSRRLLEALRGSGEVTVTDSKELPSSGSGEENRSYERLMRMGREAGADYLLVGNLHALARRTENPERALVSYRLNFELIHITSNRKAYLGNWQIKKLVEL